MSRTEIQSTHHFKEGHRLVNKKENAEEGHIPETSDLKTQVPKCSPELSDYMRL